MKPRRRVFRRLFVLSLLAFVSVLVLWIWSHRAESNFHFKTGAARYTIRSFGGDVALLGPAQDEIDDPAVRDLVRRMSEDDFDWQPAFQRRGQWVVKGVVRRGTPTFALFDRFHEIPVDPSIPARAQQMWLNALEDPHQFASASMMLMFYIPLWREANVDLDTRIPYVYLPADRGSTRPSAAGRKEAITSWHQRLDVKIISVWYGFLIAGTGLVFSLVASRPRTTPRTLSRWAYNGAAMVSALLLISILVIWIRSYWVWDRWVYIAAVSSPPRLPDAWVRRYPRTKSQFIAELDSSRGHVTIDDREIPVYQLGMGLGRPEAEKSGLQYFAMASQKTTVRKSILGFSYSSTPAQVAVLPLTRLSTNPLSVGYNIFSGGPTLKPRYRVTVIPFWLLAALVCGLPALWARGFWNNWRRKRNQNLCPVCAYDLRATPQRCPECGFVAAMSQSKS